MSKENFERRLVEIIQSRGLKLYEKYENFKEEETRDSVEDLDSKSTHRTISRRGFLKFLSLGLGGLIFSSLSGASWNIFQPSGSGKSDINAESVDGADSSNLRNLHLTTPSVNLKDGETLTLSRFDLPSSKKIYIWKAAVTLTDGSNSNLDLEVYNHSDSSTIYTTSSNTVQEGSPLASGGQNDDIEIRVKNNTGSPKDFTALMVATIK